MGARGNFKRFRDGGYRYLVTLRDEMNGYIEYQYQRRIHVTPIQNVLIHRV